MAEYKEKLHRFEDSIKDLFKSLNNYLDATKTAAEYEASFYTELKRFYSDPEPVFGGPAATAISQSNQVTSEIEKILPLIQTLKTNSVRVRADYDQVIYNFKKKLYSDDIEKVNEDWTIFEEQKADDFSPLLLLILKLREKRKPVPPTVIQQSRVSRAVDHGALFYQNMMSSLSNLLANKYGLQYFQSFLAKEFSSENIDFWLDVKEYKLLVEPELIRQKAEEIYSSYFSELAPKQINVSGAVSKRLEECIKNPDKEIFNEAEKEIFHLMETDCFKRFKEDQMSDRLRKRLENRDFWNPVAVSSPSTIRVVGTLRLSGERLLRKKILTDLTSSQPTVGFEPCFKCGWLTKQGGGKGGRKNWKRRWFIIKQTSIEYFEKPQSSDTLGEISFRKYVDVQHSIEADYAKSHTFSVTTADRTYYLIADTAEEKEEWMDIIQTLGSLYRTHFDAASRVGETPLIKMVINPAVNILTATYSTLMAFKKLPTDPEVLKDLSDQIINRFIKYVNCSLAIDVVGTDAMKGLRLQNANRRYKELIDRVRSHKDLNTDEVQSKCKALLEEIQLADIQVPGIAEITRSLSAITEASKTLGENISKTQVAPERKQFLVLHENQVQLLSMLDSFNLPSEASPKSPRILDTLKKLVSIELLSSIKTTRKAYKAVRQNPERPKYIQEFNECFQFLLSSQMEIDKLIKLLTELLENE